VRLLRSMLMVGFLGFAIAGCNSSQTTARGNASGTNNAQKSPDEQFADLRMQYNSLNDNEKRGERGKKLIADLSALMARLSDQAKNEAGKVLAGHKTLEVPNFDSTSGPELPDPSRLPIDPKDLKFPDRKTVDGKLPFDPSKIPFPLDPSKIDLSKIPFPLDASKIDPSKIPFPLDPSKIERSKLPKFPDLKSPFDPTKIPDLKFPDLPKLPDEREPILPPPREKPGT
jgi:hypothetical protein